MESGTTETSQETIPQHQEPQQPPQEQESATQTNENTAQQTQNQEENQLLLEEQSQWLPRILEEDPYLLELREKALPWTGGISFANMVHTALTASPSVFNRFSILELLYNHFLSIGMVRTAEILEKETGLKFQVYDEPWERTGLRVLVSLGVLSRENPWIIQAPPNCKFIEEPLEEDFFACQYREDPRTVHIELLDKSANVEYDSEEHSFKHIKACTLNRLVSIITTANTADKDTEMNFREDDLNAFFLTLHSITSCEHFLEHLKAVFDYDFADEKAISEVQTKYPNIRVNVARVILKWIRFHGLFIGKKTLKLIEQFAKRVIDSSIEDYHDNAGKGEYIGIFEEILNAIPTLGYGQIHEKQKIIEDPIIKDAQVLLNPALSIIDLDPPQTPDNGQNKERDPDPREVAKQITLLSYKAFSAIHSREFMVAIIKKGVTIQTPTLAEFFEFSDKIERVVLESIAKAPKPVEAVKQIYKIAESLDNLANYDALYRVVSALMIPELKGIIKEAKLDDRIQRLFKKTGSTEDTLEWYRQNLDSRFDDSYPTIPNTTSELKFAPTIVGPDFFDGKLINWEKRRQIGKIMTVLYKFQNCPYCFWPVPQIQKLFTRGGTMTDKQLGEAILKSIKQKN